MFSSYIPQVWITMYQPMLIIVLADNWILVINDRYYLSLHLINAYVYIYIYINGYIVKQKQNHFYNHTYKWMTPQLLWDFRDRTNKNIGAGFRKEIEGFHQPKTSYFTQQNIRCFYQQEDKSLVSCVFHLTKNMGDLTKQKFELFTIERSKSGMISHYTRSWRTNHHTLGFPPTKI